MPGSRMQDPSRLRLKREITQIRKASKVLRDPGTSSSWISPLGSARSASVVPNEVALNESNKKRVFLYNWRSNSNSNDLDGSSVSGSFASARSRDTRLTRAMGKAKPCKPYLLQKQRRRRMQKVSFGRNSLNLDLGLKNNAPSTSSVGLSQDDSAGLIDQFGDTEEYYNSEDLDSFSAESPLLSRLRHKKLMESISKFYRDRKGGDSSCTYSTPALSMSSFKQYLNGKVPGISGSWDGSSVSFNDLQDEEDQLDFPGQRGCGIPCYWSRRSTPRLCSSPSVSDTVRIRGTRLFRGRQKDNHSPLLSNFDEQSTNYGEIESESVSRLDGRRRSSSCRRSLSQRYRPMFFNELVGQSIVAMSLMNAITKGKISPVYLFQGPRGTGKTSAAKIFAAALNCLATEGDKPCGICRECTDFVSCKSRDIVEVDGSEKKEMDKVRRVLKGLEAAPATASSRYKVFVIEECHLLSSKIWVGLLKFLEVSLSRVVFVFITTDAENVPRTVLSRCQRYIFNKIKDSDIVRKLQRISSEERFDAETDALELIALNSDGSLRDAETMLEQLSLLGKRISASLVNELVGVVSEEKLLELLELAISSNTSETVKRARELLDSGADPLVLMSQLASLIMDIIAGNHLLDGTNSVIGRSLTEQEVQKLKHTLKLLSESEKQLRFSGERSTWFTATLLQLGSTSPEFTLSGSSRRQSSKTTDEDQSPASRDGLANAQRSGAPFLHSTNIPSSPDSAMDGNIVLRQSDMDKLNDIWRQCLAKCQHEKLRQLLRTHGKLISLSEADGLFVAYIAFGEEKSKARAERYLISITTSFEAILKQTVEVKMVILPIKTLEAKNRPSPMQRVESIIREQKLETAWLQAVEKGTPRSMTRKRINVQNKADLVSSSSNDWEDELNHEIEALKVNDKKDSERGQVDRRPITPSLLHRSLSKEHHGYESGTGAGGCSMLLCLNIRRSRRAKITRKTGVGSNRGGYFCCFRDCIKSRNG